MHTMTACPALGECSFRMETGEISFHLAQTRIRACLPGVSAPLNLFHAQRGFMHRISCIRHDSSRCCDQQSSLAMRPPSTDWLPYGRHRVHLAFYAAWAVGLALHMLFPVPNNTPTDVLLPTTRCDLRPLLPSDTGHCNLRLHNTFSTRAFPVCIRVNLVCHLSFAIILSASRPLTFTS